MEDRRKDDHRLTDDSIMVDARRSTDGKIGQTEVAALVGLNTDLRREYIADCQSGVKRWNRILETAGLPQRLSLPHVGVQPQGRRVRRHRGRRRTGELLDGRRVGARSKGEWLPTEVDKTHVRSLMRPVYERGKIASWIAPPRNGHQRPAVRLRLRPPRLTRPIAMSRDDRGCSTPATTCSTGRSRPVTATGSR